MSFSLLIAAFLAILIGLAHSYLGERYILIRLFRKTDLPKLFGDSSFTMQTLRFAWHLTTVCWWAFAAILFGLAWQDAISSQEIGLIVGATFLIHFLVALLASKGRHLSWVVFLLIGLLSIYGTR